MSACPTGTPAGRILELLRGRNAGICSFFTNSAEKSSLATLRDMRTRYAMTSAITDKTSFSRALTLVMLAGAAIAAAVSSTTPAHAEDLIVKYDQSQLLRLPRAASEIIIGNPTIADVSVQAGNLLVVTGKTFGITNIIALDADRNVIQDQRILVRRDDVKVVNLQRGTTRQSYNCTPQCNPSITIGDEQSYFDTISKASQAKIGFSSRDADSAQQSGSQ
jgi:Flp pilus assembly secretin CpaC